MKTVRLIFKIMKSSDIYLGLDGLLTITMLQIIFELFCIINCMAPIFSLGEVLCMPICCASNHLYFVICFRSFAYKFPALKPAFCKLLLHVLFCNGMHLCRKLQPSCTIVHMLISFVFFMLQQTELTKNFEKTLN